MTSVLEFMAQMDINVSRITVILDATLLTVGLLMIWGPILSYAKRAARVEIELRRASLHLSLNWSKWERRLRVS